MPPDKRLQPRTLSTRWLKPTPSAFKRYPEQLLPVEEGESWEELPSPANLAPPPLGTQSTTQDTALTPAPVAPGGVRMSQEAVEGSTNAVGMLSARPGSCLPSIAESGAAGMELFGSVSATVSGNSLAPRPMLLKEKIEGVEDYQERLDEALLAAGLPPRIGREVDQNLGRD